MIILDTNVISEPLKPSANQTVIDWLDRQDPNTLYLTTISLAELLVGVNLLPKGKRKNNLSKSLNNQLSELFESRILTFDQNAAIAYADLYTRARKSGYVISVSDGQIASIAATNNFIVATRDTEPFMTVGLSVINPWDH